MIKIIMGIITIIILYILLIQIKKYIHKINENKINKFNKVLKKDIEKIRRKCDEYTLNEEFKEQLAQKLEYEYHNK